MPFGIMILAFASPSLAARRLYDLRGRWEGEIVTGEETYAIAMDIERQNPRNGKIRGRADVFEEGVSLSGQVRRKRKLSATVHTHLQSEPVTVRFDLVGSPDAKSLVGTAFARSRVSEDIEGIVTMHRV
jgi:hypothetical protein